MTSQGNSLPVPARTSVHRLQGKDLRKWWQDPLAVRKDDVYANVGIQQLLVTLLTVPILAIASYYRFASWTMIAPGLVLWLAVLFLLLSFFRRHRYHVLQVTASESGLDLKSPFLERTIHWSEIADFFPAGTMDPKEFVLQCRNGEEFFLLKDLTNSADLFGLIITRMAKPEVVYDLNYRLPDGYRDLGRSAAFVTLGVGVWTVAQALLNPNHLGVMDPANLLSLMFLVVFYALALAWCWINLTKAPQLIRAGRAGLCIQTDGKRQVIMWEQITQIRYVANWIVVRSRYGWFVMMASKAEPMAEKLLERKASLLLQDRQRPL